MLKLEFTPQDVQTILKALASMPLGESLQAYMRLQQQLAAAQGQGAPAPMPPAVTPPGKPNGNGHEAGE
jgi:hypothetical protein